MKDLLELAELAWHGELDLQFEHHPVHMFYNGSTELKENLLGIKGIAGHYTIDTGDGLVMIDAGSQLDVDTSYEEIRKWRPDTPVKAAIFTHHHVDHIFAVKHFDIENTKKGIAPPVVYGHELMPDHFDRYVKTKDWNTAINRRQFAIDVEHFAWPDEYRYPDITYKKNISFECGDLTFNLYHARGETDDHTWIHIPERKIIAPGDLFIWAVPNGGNPQKVQRYISDWADALDEMLKLDCEIFIPGHGFPIFGKDRIKKALETTSSFLRTIEDQTLILMNQGKSLNQVLHEETLVFCAHEYTQSNLKFALSINPNNSYLVSYSNKVEELRSKSKITLPSTIGLEKKINPFFLLKNDEILNNCETFLGGKITNQIESLAAIRSMKDSF
ncbi:MBL fold metallo-hydrolase [SAR86 cluster bacterium]|nr:MBL fold metallo-hydrolase [SAR86 cluster bacterium]